MYGIIEGFYEALSRADSQRYEQGQMWWTCCPYLFTRPYVTRILADGRTREMDLRRFDPRQEDHDEELGTEPGEFLAIT
jgi:hypothetical protein